MKSGRQKGGQELAQGVDNRVCHVLCAGTEMEDWKKLRAGIDGQPEKDAPVWSCAAWCAAHPAADAGAGDGRRSVRARSVHVAQRESERLVMVACREPCDPFGSGRVQPFSQREIRTMAIW